MRKAQKWFTPDITPDITPEYRIYGQKVVCHILSLFLLFIFLVLKVTEFHLQFSDSHEGELHEML